MKAVPAGAAPRAPHSSDIRIASKLLRFDQVTSNATVRKKYFRREESPWHLIPIGDAWLPPSPVNPLPIRLRERPDLCRTVVATLDTYLQRRIASKSTHIVVADIAKFLIKLIEYAWLKGFYRLQDMPAPAWGEWRNKLVSGGFVAALDIEERTVRLLREVQANAFLRAPHNTEKNAESVRTEFLERLGTNISSRELAWIRPLLIQARNDEGLARSGDLSRYSRNAAQAMSVTMLLQCLRAFNQLAEVDGPYGLPYLPTEDADAFARKHGRQGGRTANVTPVVAAALLKSAFEWIYDYGPAVVRLIEEVAVQLAYYVSPEVERIFQGVPNADHNFNAYKSSIRAKVLSNASTRKEVESLLGLRITTYVKKDTRGDETSLYALLNKLFSACFVVLATMNARRKDEISHKVIGLHMRSLAVLDEQLDLAECEFYIEKTIKDYEKFFINSVSRRALELLESIAVITWGWAEYVLKEQMPEGRDEKIFCYPSFASAHKGVAVWYDFNQNPSGMANQFLEDALGPLFQRFSVAPHMFRRLYGIIYHYRFEDATLVALAQKYRHLDVTSVLRYVTNGLELSADQHPLSLWGTGKSRDPKIVEIESIGKEIAAVGEEKLREFVEAVVDGGKSFGGQFARLVGRFHRHLSGHVDYSRLDSEEKAAKLAKTLLARGHHPEPFKDVTCMAGRSRPGAACATDGRLAQERAGALVCTGCPYSLIVAAHLDVMEQDAALLKVRSEAEHGTHAAALAERELVNLNRVITLNRARLGLQSGQKEDQGDSGKS